MALDPNIPLSVKLPEIQSPQQAQAQAMTLRNLAMQGDLDQARLQDYQAQAQDRQQSVADRQALDAAFAQPGAPREAILNAVPGHLRAQVEKSFADADEAQARQRKTKAEADAAEADYFGALAAGVKPFLASGKPEDAMGAAQIALAHAKAAGYQDADAIWKQIQDNPAILPQVVDGLIAQSPKFSQLATTQANTAATQASTAAARAETARHNAAMEAISRSNANREAASQAETARHNREMERLQNPFAGMMTPGGGNAAPAGSPAPTATPGAQTPPAQAPTSVQPGGVLPGWTDQTGPHGADFLKTLPGPMANEVKAYAEGRRPFPAGMSQYRLEPLIQAVGQYDPTFDAANFNGRNKARQDFTAGASAKQITALNTVIGHLADLDEKAGVLGNSSVQSYNALKNWVKTELGSPSVTNFNTVKKGVTDELTRVWRQAGGSEQDIKTWAESLNAAQSPEQLTGAFSTIAGMLESRLDALKNQRDQGLGPFGSDIAIITPKSQQALDKLRNDKAPVKVGAFTVTVKP